MWAVLGQLVISKQNNKAPRVSAAVEFINNQSTPKRIARAYFPSGIEYSRCPNMSLKLTVTAVDDFAARCGTIRKVAASSARMRYDDLAARRRSLAPVR